MGSSSLEQAQGRADSLIAAGAVPVTWGDGTLGVRPSVRAKAHIVFSAAPAEKPAAEKRSNVHLIAVRDLHSPAQIFIDSAFVLALSVLTGIADHALFFHTIGPIREFVGTGLIVAVFFAGIVRLVDSRHPATLTARHNVFRDTAFVWSTVFAVLVFFVFALKAGDSLSRGAVLTFYVVGLFAMGVWRALTPHALVRIASKTGYAMRECIVVGDDRSKAPDSLAAELASTGNSKPTVIKFRANCDGIGWPQEHKRLIRRSIKAAHALNRGEIYLCAAGVPAIRLDSIRRALSVVPRAIYIVPDAEVAALVTNKVSTVGSHVAVEVRSEPLGLAQRAIKRLVDVTLSFLALIALAPFFVAVAITLKLDSSGPVFFRQTRNGYRGRPFKIFKFRTMHVQEDGLEVRQASRGDARVTRVGGFLRKTSIDELPQLLNVLLGHMSLVGPRPHARAHDELYAKAIENYDVRQHVKPGITGWAQVHGLRGETATLDLMYRRIEYDLWYAVHASVLLDAEILIRTVYEVVRQRNAY